MPKSKASDEGTLQLCSQAGRQVIFVPTANASALRIYLRTKGLTSTHPHTVSGDTSSLEVLTRFDSSELQTILDEWKVA
jgi:hypothetical protein